MSAGLDDVQKILAEPEDVHLPEGLALPGDDGAPDDDARFGDDPGFDPDGDFGFGGMGGNPPPPTGPDGPDADRIRRAADLPLNDYGNGQRFALHFGEDLIWVPRVGWFTWSGKVWVKDPDLIATRARAQRLSGLISLETRHIVPTSMSRDDLVARKMLLDDRAAELHKIKTADRSAEESAEMAEIKKTIEDIDAELGRVQGRIGERLRHAKNAGNSGPITNMIAESGIALARSVDVLDADKLEVNTLSGVLRFRTIMAEGMSRMSEVQLVPHDRAQLLTKIIPVGYDPAARAPEFERFLTRIQPKPEMRRFLQRVFGLAMTGLTGDQMLCFFYGMGANGKSVLIDLIARILGDYAATAKIESLTGTNRRGGGDATPDLVPLIGARMVRASEPDEGVRWQEGLIKDLTGGEPILVRALHSDFVSIRPEFKLIISGNHKPDIRGTDDGIWRRLKLVPFDEQIPVAERIPKNELDATLFAEAPGVLNWMVQGLLDYLEGGLQEPEAVLLATQEFRDESDPFGAFLEDACLVTGQAEDALRSTDLVYAFLYWQSLRGEGQFKDRTVALAMKDRSRRWRSRKTGQKFTEGKSGGLMKYYGIRFTDFFNAEWSKAPKDHKGRAVGLASSEGVE